MNSRIRSVAVLALVAVSSSVESAIAQSTTRASVDSAGAEANANSTAAWLSGEGRLIAFASNASNLVTGDANAARDVFVRDRLSGITELVSKSTGGAQGDAGSGNYGLAISADGRFVAFESVATNLVANDTNGKADIFVCDRVNGTTERVSVSTSGVQGNSNSFTASLSADGRFVTFYSLANNLVAGDTNMLNDVFLRDRQAGTTELISVDSAGVHGNATSYASAITPDGRFVAFESFATNLVVGDTNGMIDIFVRDRTSGITELISLDSAGVQTNDFSYDPSISANGRYVAFQSHATNLIPNDTNLASDVFVHDRQSGITERVNVDSSGAEANASSYWPSISASGDYVAFYSYASNLVALDTNAMADVFVRNRVSATTERVSVTTGGVQGNAKSEAPEISADGRIVVFRSVASNLVSNDTNAVEDIFVRERALGPSAYCTSGTTTNGCSASITASADPSLSFAHACILSVTNVEGLKFGIVFYGVDNTNFAPVSWAPGSTSLRCVKYPVQRTPLQNSGGTFSACNGSYALNWNAYQYANPHALGSPWNAGAKVYAQAWFRDPFAVKSTNLSNAVEFTYLP